MTLKLFKTKELRANYRKKALTIPWLKGITNTLKKNLGILKNTLGICPKIKA